jgi:tetratricopeptide (TPR) repeat protein
MNSGYRLVTSTVSLCLFLLFTAPLRGQTLEQAEALFAVGRYKDAKKAFEQVIKKDKQNINAYLGLAITLETLRDHFKAVEICQKAVEIDPNNVRAHLYMAIAASEMMDEGRTVQAYQQVIKITRDEVKLYTMLGNAFYDLGRYVGAITSYERALRLDPKNARTLAYLGHALRGQKRYTDARKNYDTALQYNPQEGEAFYGLCEIQLVMDHPDEAIMAGEQAIQAIQDRPEPFFALAKAYAVVGRDEDAVRVSERGVALKPNHPDVFLGMGSVYERLGRFDDALTAYKKAVELNESDYRGYLGMSAAYRKQGLYKEAVKAAKAGVDVTPDIGTVYLTVGEAYLAMKDYGAADTQYRLAYQFSNETEALEAYLGLGQTNYIRGDYNAAKDWYQQAISQRKDDPRGYLGLGAALRATEKPDQAINAFKTAQVYETNVGQGNALIELARMYVLQRQGEEAVAAAQQYLDQMGWKSEQAAFASVLRALGEAARGGDAAASLSEAVQQCDAERWPFPVLRYLHKDASPDDILAAAQNPVHQTQARTYIGLSLALSGQTDRALEQLNWVKENGDRSVVEYVLAVNELKRLKK